MTDWCGEAIASASLRLGNHACGVLARLAGPLGDSARAAATQQPIRATRGVAPSAIERLAVPPNVRAVHPTWIEAVLDELPVRTRSALAGGPRGPLEVWLVRWATAEVPPMVFDRAGEHPPRSLDRAGRTHPPRPLDARGRGLDAMIASAPEQLVAWLAAIGHDQLAFALGDARASSIAALAPAALRIAKPPRLGNLGPKRAALARCRDGELTDELAPLRIAGRALAPHLATDQLARLALTRRLPRPLGVVVHRELIAHAATFLDQCPTWAALSAE